MRCAVRIACLAILGLAGAQAIAQTRYVSDQFEVNLRSGTTNAHAILRLLPSGTRLEVLETDDASGYTRVRTRNGVEGWVLTRYLMDEPPARERLAALEERVRVAESASRQQQATIAQIKAARDEAERKATTLEQQTGQLEQELSDVRQAAANVLAIEERNRTLEGRVAEVGAELAGLRRQNERLADRSKRDWFVAGAGVVGLGVLLGLLLPRLRLPRKSSWREY